MNHKTVSVYQVKLIWTIDKTHILVQSFVTLPPALPPKSSAPARPYEVRPSVTLIEPGSHLGCWFTPKHTHLIKTERVGLLLYSVSNPPLAFRLPLLSSLLGEVCCASALARYSNLGSHPQRNDIQELVLCKLGESGIRTHDTVTCITIFETVPFGHSGISPGRLYQINQHVQSQFAPITLTKSTIFQIYWWTIGILNHT